ncbi:MAG: phosphoglucosamine mutase, partial [Candidatus Diapherotrites archaeon]|nr:phosphoglucosamine mutase [Candidatus Diapherotrites archaeon]
MNLFGTDGIRGKANEEPMTPLRVMLVGKALARLLRQKMPASARPKILIGKDTRLSNYMLETAITSGILSEGVDVFLVGPMPTPAVSHLTKSFAADAGIMLTASHNPAFDNGIKVFGPEGFKVSEKTETEIEQLVFSPQLLSTEVRNEKLGRAKRIDDAAGRYIELCKSTISNRSLKGLRVVVDCAHGAAYKMAPVIFSELGAQVSVLGNQPDGTNINLHCGALTTSALQSAVRKTKSHLGIALDGDGDRAVFVDETGKSIEGEAVLAAFALHFQEQDRLHQQTVVTTLMANHGFIQFMQKNGIRTELTPVGDKFIIQKMREKEYSLGGEPSGHIIFREFSAGGDGIVSSLQFLHLLLEKKWKASRVRRLIRLHPQVLLNVSVKSRMPFSSIPEFARTLKEIETRLGSNGRVLVRYSGTEPLARIMIEGPDSK